MYAQAMAQAYPGRKRPEDPDSILSDRTKGGLYSHIGLNLRLSRCHFLPSSYIATTPHRNRRAHAGLQLYGVGRRLCLTSRANLALIPAESLAGDSIALLRGASFPYVLRRTSNGMDHVLIGESFIPTWLGPTPIEHLSHGVAEELFRTAGNIDLRTWIRVC